MGNDEYYPSLSSSPSPPVCIQGSDMLKVLLRSDSAPYYIPTSRLGDVPISCNKTVLPFSPPNDGSSRTLSLLDRSSTARPGSPNAGKLLAFWEEEIAKPSGVKILSSSSPHRSFSRSFSRLSYEDSYDDSEFSGPFVVDDDDDIIDHGSRPGSSDRSGNRGMPYERSGTLKNRRAGPNILGTRGVITNGPQ